MMSRNDDRPDTIVLIHGLWMTPRCWERWIPRYEARGFRVLAPAYPGLESGVEALRADPSPIETPTVAGCADHLARIIRELPRPPIIIGHAFGGALVQMLLARGLGAAGIAIASVHVRGVLRLPLTTLRALWPVLKSPANRHRAVPLSPEQFHYAFTNRVSEHESMEIYRRHHVPAPGRIVFEGATASFRPRPALEVEFAKKDRAPLLFVAGSEDHMIPAAVNRANYQQYETGIVAYREITGRDHGLIAEHGWEEVADLVLDWALRPVVRLAA
jgi:pimeloyl-ACP methyl ester carboxylesterase